MPETISTELAASRMRALVRSGFGAGLPRRRNDRWILLHAVRSALPDSGTLSERATNDRLRTWLLETGGRIEVDHVTLRRALVDEGFVERTSDGARYWVSNAYERFVRFVEPGPGAPEGH